MSCPKSQKRKSTAWTRFETYSTRNSVDLSLDFNAWELKSGDLCGLVLVIFHKLDLCDCLGVTLDEMLDFILDVEAGYLCNPYHSFHHAVDVCVILYYMLFDLGAACCLSQQDILILLISGLCHDLGHPGVNNLYQVNTKTELAEASNGISVLENYSCRLTAELVAKHHLFEKPDSKLSVTVTELENWIVSEILATDMSLHFSLSDELSELIESWPNSASRCGVDNDSGVVSGCDEDLAPQELRLKLCQILLHAADISNPVRPWPLCKAWSDLVVSEFFHQGDLEKRNGLAISHNMDRDKANQPQIALDFDEYLVKPFYEAVSEFIPSFSIFLDHLSTNRDQWHELKHQLPQSHRRDSADDALFSVRRVSSSAGTVILPPRFYDEARRFSYDYLRGTGNQRSVFKRTTSQLAHNSRDGYSPDKLKTFNYLKPTISRMSSSESLSTSPLSLDRSAVS